MAASSERLSFPKRPKLKDASHLFLMWTPNILNPGKLAANVRHPLREVFHTSHRQYPIDMKEGIEYYVVEHRRFTKLETVDVVRQDVFAKGLIPRVKQLFDRNFYYGHDQHFPHHLD